MLKIGDFSKVVQVSVKTLRYYGERGLLEPAWMDRFTGYRDYTLDQLPRLNRELYWQGPESDVAPDEYVTEVQFPS